MAAKIIQITESSKQIQHMKHVFAEQKKAFRKNPMPTLQERTANLKKLRKMLMDNQVLLASKWIPKVNCYGQEPLKSKSIWKIP